jgi:two-component system sensor histidine kinase SenX3
MNLWLTVVAIAASVVVVSTWLRRRSGNRDLARRLNRIVLTLDPTPVSDDASLEQLLDRLESGAEAAAIEVQLGLEQRHRLVLAFGHLGVGVVVTDHEGRTVVRNSVADEFLAARNAAALVGAAVTDLLKASNKGRAGQRTVTLTGPPSRLIEVTARPLFDGHRPMGAVALIEDRSDAARIDRTRRDFVANLSHELRSPVGAIALLSDTLLDESDPKVRTRLVDRIGIEAERVGLIIDDLLELSRVELDGLPRRDLVDAEGLLAEVADQHRHAAEAKDIKLLRLPAASDVRLHGDKGQLVRAVGNLLENAIKYSDPESTVEMAATAHGRHVDIIFRDQGHGIPQHEHERIFERFYRVDKARSRSTGGTGLGLSIVRHVVANHGGEILVRSREGEGATFVLRLPTEGDA